VKIYVSVLTHLKRLYGHIGALARERRLVRSIERTVANRLDRWQHHKERHIVAEFKNLEIVQSEIAAFLLSLA